MSQFVLRYRSKNLYYRVRYRCFLIQYRIFADIGKNQYRVVSNIASDIVLDIIPDTICNSHTYPDISTNIRVVYDMIPYLFHDCWPRFPQVILQLAPSNLFTDPEDDNDPRSDREMDSDELRDYEDQDHLDSWHL